MHRTLTMAFAGLLAGVSTASDCIFEQKDGLVVVEIESAELAPGWVEETELIGFTGSSYYRWDGQNYYNSPGHGILEYQFELETSGWHGFRIRNRHENPDSHIDNDVWVRVDGGEWKKFFSNGGEGNTGVWNWNTRIYEGGMPNAYFILDAGVHTIEFSGRSRNFMMDRFHIFTPGHPLGLSEFQPESECSTGLGTSYCTSSANSSGGAALITADGSTSIAANDLTLTATPVPANKVGVFYYGPEPNSVPFGNGTRCVAAGNLGTFRLPVTPTDTGGFLVHAVDNQSPPQPAGLLSAGSTWFFQAWFRDPDAGGAGHDLSDGLELTFLP